MRKQEELIITKRRKSSNLKGFDMSELTKQNEHSIAQGG